MKIIVVNYFKRLIFPLILLFICQSTFGFTLHLKPGPSSAKDAYLSSDAPNTVYGNHAEFSGTAWTCNFVPCFGRGLLHFDLSSIPAGVVIIDARISLYANPTPANGGGIAMQGDNESVLQRVITNWSEDTVTWNSAPSSTTVNQVILNQSNNPFQDYLNIDVKSLIQDMVNDPVNGFGFLLRLTTENFYSSMIFASSDYPDSALWPEITIEYVDSVQIGCQELLLENGQGGDIYLSSNAPDTNYGNHEELSGDAWTCSFIPCFGRGLFSFDLTSIPVNSQIISAKLDLYANPNPSNGNGIAMQGNNAALIQRVVTSWTENLTTWNTAPNTTTQNEVMLAQSTSSFQDYLDIDVKNLVQDLVDNPASSYGFILRLIDETPFASMIFASSDYPNSSFRPKLKICYSIVDEISEFNNQIGILDVFPNPTSGNLKIVFDKIIKSKVSISVFDLIGKKVFNKIAISNSNGDFIEIDLSSLVNGIYFGTVENKFTETKKFKIVKQ